MTIIISPVKSIAKRLGVALTIGWLALCLPTYAQETTETPPAAASEGKQNGDQETDNKQANTKPSSEKQTDGKQDNSDDVFVPTEEISEDLSVSFPVDI